jgi:hypothetical protein
MIDPESINQSGSADPLHEATEIGAWMRQGEAEFYDTATPLSALLNKDVQATDSSRSDALTEVMAYLFAGTPHPATVMHRLYRLTYETEPTLLRTLPALELRGLLVPVERKGGALTGWNEHLWRCAVLLRGTRLERRAAAQHDKIIERILTAAHHRNRAALGRTEDVALEDVLKTLPDEELEAYESRMAAIGAVLGFFFLDGAQPELTILRVFAMAKAHHSHLIFDMTVRQLGDVFGVEGATWSERIKQKVNRFLEDRGASGVKARFQKSDEACGTYARAQRGNHNRRSGEPMSA